MTPATLFHGRVATLTGKPMASVSVSAVALGIRDGLPEVARYNRSDYAKSNRYGEFSLAVDVGVYDLVAMPAEGSGYPWVLSYSGRISASGPRDRQLTIVPQVPVLGHGRVVDSTGAALPDAQVEAFAMVPNEEGGPDRAVRIARAVSDERGEFTLLLPHNISTPPPDVEVDAGAASDGG